jgi:hypothetical protein
MSLQYHSWPYGTTRRGQVCIANWRPHGLNPKTSSGQLIRDEFGEMHICVSESCADFSAKEGDEGTLTFTKDGPTGGYWKFKKDIKP